MIRLRIAAGGEAEVTLSGVRAAAGHGGPVAAGDVAVTAADGGPVAAGDAGEAAPDRGRLAGGAVVAAAADGGKGPVGDRAGAVAGLVVGAPADRALVVGDPVGARGIRRRAASPAPDRRGKGAGGDRVVGGAADHVGAWVGAIGCRLKSQAAGVVDPQVERLVVGGAEEVGTCRPGVAGELPGAAGGEHQGRFVDVGAGQAVVGDLGGVDRVGAEVGGRHLAVGDLPGARPSWRRGRASSPRR